MTSVQFILWFCGNICNRHGSNINKDMDQLLVGVIRGICLLFLLGGSQATFFPPPGFHSHMVPHPHMHPSLHHAMKKHHMMKKFRPMVGPHGFMMPPPVHAIMPMHAPPMVPMMKMRPIPMVGHKNVFVTPDMVMMNKMLKKKILAKTRYQMPSQPNTQKPKTVQRKTSINAKTKTPVQKSSPGGKGNAVVRTGNPRPSNMSPSQFRFGPMQLLPVAGMAKFGPVVVDFIHPAARVTGLTLDNTFVGNGYPMVSALGTHNGRIIQVDTAANHAIGGSAAVGAGNAAAPMPKAANAAMAAASSSRIQIPKPIPALFEFKNGPVQTKNVGIGSPSIDNRNNRIPTSPTSGRSIHNKLTTFPSNINPDITNVQLQDTLLSLSLGQDGTVKGRGVSPIKSVVGTNHLNNGNVYVPTSNSLAQWIDRIPVDIMPIKTAPSQRGSSAKAVPKTNTVEIRPSIPAIGANKVSTRLASKPLKPVLSTGMNSQHMRLDTTIAKKKVKNTLANTLGIDFTGHVGGIGSNGAAGQGGLYTDLSAKIPPSKTSKQGSKIIPDAKHATVQAKKPTKRIGQNIPVSRKIGVFNTKFGP